MKTFIQTTFYESLKPLLLALGTLYVALTVAHALSLPPDVKPYLVSCAVLSAAVLYGLYAAIRFTDKGLQKYTMLVAALGVIGIPTINTLLHLYLVPDAKQSTNLILVILGAGIILLDTRWFLVTTITGLAGWVLILFPEISAADKLHYGIALAMTFFASFFINRNRISILKDLINSRKAQSEQNLELRATQKELEQTIVELQRAKDAAEAASIAKEQFLSNVSHELRTPLNAVIGLAQLLELNDPREDQLEDLRTMHFSANNLLELINEVLDFSKINAGELEFEASPVDLATLLVQLVRSHEVKAQQKGIRFEYQMEGEFPPYVLGDELRLKQIINNLLSNAIKFTNQGGVTLTVMCKPLDDMRVLMHVEVTDTGIGISPEQQEVIFEPFKQADNSITRRFGGTGLGLAITNKLLIQFGSKLQIRSTKDKGSEFSFDLSLFRCENDVIKEEKVHKPVKVDLKGMHVLLVDDNEVNLAVLNKVLKSWNAQTETASTGQQAIDSVNGHNYDLVLMDLQMPGMDGLQAAQRIRSMENPKQSEVPILAVTASTLPEIIEGIYEVGMNGYLFKPLRQEQLFEALQPYLKNY